MLFSVSGWDLRTEIGENYRVGKLGFIEIPNSRIFYGAVASYLTLRTSFGSLSWTKIGSGVIAVATAGSAFLYCSNLNLERDEIEQEIYSTRLL